MTDRFFIVEVADASKEKGANGDTAVQDQPDDEAANGQPVDSMPTIPRFEKRIS